MQTIELTVKESLELQNELQNLLAIKAPIKLKFELTELMLKAKVRNEAAQKLIDEILKEHGFVDIKTQRMSIKMYNDAEEKTEQFKQLEEIWAQQIKLDYEPINIKLFDNIESDMNFPNLFKLIENNHQ